MNRGPPTNVRFLGTDAPNRDLKPKEKKKTRLILIPDAHYIVASKTIFSPIMKELEQRPWLPLGSGLAGKDFARYRYDFMSNESFYESEEGKESNF